MEKVDWPGVVFVAGIILLAVLFCGEPDLMDAIIHRLMR